MLQVTQDALAICRTTVRQLDMLANTKCLRLIESDDGIAISFELPRSDDELLHDLGPAVLAAPENVADALAEMTLDVRDDGRFVLSRCKTREQGKLRITRKAQINPDFGGWAST